MTMPAERSKRAINRVLAKLDASVEAGDYYEAHQMYRSLYFRYTSQQKYEECLEILYQGATTLLKKEQYCSAADITLLIIDTLEKMRTMSSLHLWIPKFGGLLKQISPSTVERETIINRAVKWTADVSGIPSGHPDLHKIIAELLWSEDNPAARHHFLHSQDGVLCGNMLVELSVTKGYPRETDLFIAQTVLQLLCLKYKSAAVSAFNTYTANHPRIKSTKPPYGLPLLNFLFILLKAVDTGRLSMFQKLCETYKPSTDRDPSYEKYLQKIGINYFGAPPPPDRAENGGFVGMGGIFGDIVNRLFQEVEEFEQYVAENPEPPRRNNRINHVNTNELE